VLFNASIRYNIAYGQLSTTTLDENTIVSSAQATQMHDRIMSFLEEYKTKVREMSMGARSKGLRLLGLW
jgi:ABC-type transport system involved in Fe-S cluster assembly fused permease/ATPase subunit